MAFASGSRHELSFVAESTYGTTPGSPTMSRVRHTSDGIILSKENYISEEIRADRQIVDARHGTRQAGGDVAFELSYGALDAFLESAFFGTFTSDVLKVGTTVKSMTLERRFLDVNQFQTFTGCIVNTMSLNVQPNQMVTGTFGIIGKAGANSGTSLGTPSDVATNAPFDSFSGSITEGGATVASVSQIQLNLDNGINPAFVIGSDVTPQMIYGRSNLTGTVTAYFESTALLSKFLDENESSLVFTLTDPDGNEYEISLPRIKYMSGENPVTSPNEAVMLTMNFQALLDASAGSNIVITRTAAV